MHEDAHPDPEMLASIIVNSGLKVHRALGPSLFESAYERTLPESMQASKRFFFEEKKQKILFTLPLSNSLLLLS